MLNVVTTFQMHHAWLTPTTEKNAKRNSQRTSILKQFSTKMDTLFTDVVTMGLPLQRQSIDKQLPSTIAMLSHTTHISVANTIPTSTLRFVHLYMQSNIYTSI